MLQEIEKLQYENKTLRVELQKLDRPQEFFDSRRNCSRAQTSEEGDSENKGSEREMRATNTRILPGSSQIEKRAINAKTLAMQPQCLSPMDLNHSVPNDIKRIAELQKWTEISTHAIAMQSKLIQKGRCPVCTLSIPCKHFGNVEEAIKRIPKENNLCEAKEKANITWIPVCDKSSSMLGNNGPNPNSWK